MLVVSGCALRPRYDELAKRFVPQEGAPTEVQVQVLDGNEAPVPGARIEIGERNRFRAVTDEQGIFKMPTDKKYADENGLVVVTLPPGVKKYQLVAPGSKRPEAPAAGAEPDAGTITTL
jgi:hypothetical protein